jgi:type IV secretory pathway TraG/TraD family ATPase VirD4
LREHQRAKHCSELLGTITEKRKTITRDSDTTVGEQLERRALMLPQDMKALPNDQ